MKKIFIPVCIFILIILIITIGFYQYETYKLEDKNKNIEENINKYNELNKEVEQYKLLLEDISLITTSNDELNLKLNSIKEEIRVLNEEISIINAYFLLVNYGF